MPNDLIYKQCTGFLNTPPLWHGNEFGITQFVFPETDLIDFIPDEIEDAVDDVKEVVKETKRRAKAVKKELKDVADAAKEVVEQSKDVVSAAKGKKRRGRKPKSKK